jgi:hypothetical protein
MMAKPKKAATAHIAAPEWEVPTLVEWLAQTKTRHRWLVPGWVPQDGIVLVSGPRKLGNKTYTAFVCAASLASGKQVFPFSPVKPAPILIIEEEGGTAQTSDRWHAIAAAYPGVDKGYPSIHFAFRQLVKLNREAWRQKLVAKVKKLKPSLVIIDAMAYVIDGDENKTVDMQDALSTVQSMRAQGCAVMILHHLNNERGYDPKADIDQQVRGAGPLKDLYDLHIALRRYKDTDPIQVTVRQRDGSTRHDVFSWEFKEDEEGNTVFAKLHLGEGSASLKLDETSKRLLSLMKPGQVHSKNDLKELWGMQAKVVDKAAAALVKDGHLHVSGEGWVVQSKKIMSQKLPPKREYKRH